MEYIFEITWFCWLLSEIILNRLFRSKAMNSKETDRNSLRWIWFSILTSISLGILSAIFLPFPFTHSDWIRYIGLLMIISGMIFRLIAILTLEKFFTVDVSVQGNHQLINKGLYKYIRHPSYSGSLLSFIGFGLSLNNWISLILVVFPVLISFLNRISIEERLMLKEFGSAYEDYQKNTSRLFPILY